MLPRFPGMLLRVLVGGCMQQWAGLQLSFSAQGAGEPQKRPQG